MSGETNQVVWRGVRPVEGIRGIWPARNAVRINQEATQAGEGNAIVYTVPANKIFFMTTAGMAAFNSAGGGKFAGVGVRNGADAHQIYLCFHYFAAQAEHSHQHRYFPAIEVIAGYDVYVVTDSANITALGMAHGWLEDA